MEMWHAIFYPKDKFEEWHDVKCLYGEYNMYGVDILPLYPMEVEGYKGQLM